MHQYNYVIEFLQKDLKSVTINSGNVFVAVNAHVHILLYLLH